MPSYKVRVFLGFSLVFCLLLAACGGGKPTSYKSLSVAATNPPNAYLGIAYGFTFAATGGKTPYAWSISAGSLPAGLTLNASTGAISGTPTSATSYTFTVQCTDSQTPTAAVSTRNFTIQVKPITALSITTKFLTGAYVNNVYTTTLAASGGVTPYTWTIDSGSLPAGLTLSSAGVISGTPTTVGSSSFTVKVADSQPTPATATQALTLQVITPTALAIASTTLTDAFLANPYTATLIATGGIQPYFWKLTSGSLPAGLTMSNTGVISGTPTALGASTFTVQVTDSETTAQTVSATLTLTVDNVATLMVTTTTLPNATIGTSYFETLAASGGITPYTWSLIGGSLPTGLTLSPSGIISGKPTGPTGTSSFTVQVKDSGTTQQTASGTVTIVVTTVGQNLLNGNYAFSINGFSNGSPIYMAGSLVSDGAGNITSGVIDITSSTGTVKGPLTANTYSLNNDGSGTVTLNAGSLGSYQLQVAAPLSGAAIRFLLNNNKTDQTGTYGSGYMLKQDTSAFNVSSMAGTYVFGISGVDSKGGRLGRIGVQTIDATGAISAGDSDVNDAGAASDVTTASGTYGLVDATTGRSKVLFNDSTGDTNYVAYIVSANSWILLEAESTTPAAMTIGSVVKQSLGNSGVSLLSGSTILELSGINGTAADVEIGKVAFTSSTSTTFTSTLDENNGGVVKQNGYSGNVTVTTATGHVTFSGPDPLPVTMYIARPNSALVLGADKDATVKFGTLQPQNLPSFTDAAITGSYLGASTVSIVPAMVNEADLFTSDGAGNLSAITTYTSGPTGNGSNSTAETGTYTTIDANGRTTIAVVGGDNYIAWVLSTGEFVMIPSNTTDTQPKIIVMDK